MTEATSAIRRSRGPALLASVVLLAAGCGDNNESKTTAQPTDDTTPSIAPNSGQTSPQPTPTGPITATGKKPRGGGRLLVSNRTGRTRDLYPLLGGSLTPLGSAQVTGSSVRVVALAGSEAFWVGRNRSLRLLVHIRLKGQSPPKVRAGQKVTFIGQLTTGSSDSATTLGVKDAAGAALLSRQGAYLEVSIGDLTGS